VIVRRMEAYLSRKQTLPEVTKEVEFHQEEQAAFAEIFRNPSTCAHAPSARDVVPAYVTVFSIAAASRRYSPR